MSDDDGEQTAHAIVRKWRAQLRADEQLVAMQDAVFDAGDHLSILFI